MARKCDDFVPHVGVRENYRVLVAFVFMAKPVKQKTVGRTCALDSSLKLQRVFVKTLGRHLFCLVRTFDFEWNVSDIGPD